MDVLERANALIEAARNGEEDDTLRPRQEALLGAWDTSADEGRTEVVAAMSRAIEDPSIDPGSGALLAITAGAMVESGADTMAIGSALLGRIPAVLGMAKRFQDRCLDCLAEDADEDDESAVEMLERRVPLEHVRHHAREDVEGALAWQGLDRWALPTIACLTRDPTLRSLARDRPQLRQLAYETLGYSGFLTMALDILDDETLLVLHPATEQGFEVTISGIAVNFDLHLLLADLLIRDGSDGIPGERPNAIAVRNVLGEDVRGDLTCVGPWNLHDWRALQADGSLIEESDFWIWNEGRPADIPAFEGQRVVLISPPPYSRSWHGQRTFGGLCPELSVRRTLDEATVRAWMTKLASAPRD